MAAKERSKAAVASGEEVVSIAITPPKFGYAKFRIKGASPYLQAKFSAKTKQAMMDKMAKGSQSKKGQKRDARNFDEDYEQAKHISTEGWCGIPASSIRNACISACRIVGFKMTMAKLSIFVEADGFDRDEGTPLIKIEGTPEKTEMMTRNATGVCDIRVRPMWREWAANVCIRYDEEQFSRQDVTNLLMRVGLQVGLGEGRPDSKSSAGMGFGLFTVE